MSGLSDTKKRLALSVIDFLQQSTKDGSLSADDAENIEVATSCIADAFKVDATDSKAIKDAVGSQNLLKIFSVYETMQGRGAASQPAASSSSSSAPSTSAQPSQPSPESEKLKSAGNAAMQQKDYKTAIQKYTEAISQSPTNPIYLSNRAAAYSASGDHAAAVKDAEIAVASDPKYTKAWSRLGLARFAMGDARGSVEAYQKGIEYEGNGGSDAMKKGLETAKRELERMEAEEDDMEADPIDDAAGSTRSGAGAGVGAGGMPDLSALAGMFGGGGAGGSGGGMPDLAGLMQNPMMRQMAQNLMQNPEALSGIMNNPMLRNMMGRGQGGEGGQGGGMPDMSQIQQMMQDPNIANLASQFMGGAGRGAGGGAGRGQ
ncbi:Small glutamine-rich tetratricopeptide repeat-containing protein 2 [Knufia obscura]|uniref:Small glutamine-rich tetratricopeptide repeat-containing protein 2 n=2 Tax=Knufia TaxID=430999 RepID=A0AAN8IAW4_9EURO|nr:Small glutamine-rich tetratricopeptide repeat-containing protein 2 [Knufia obscura]KAK5956120.1 Small glutamine-rich tetratricopeptide repeat-containing protein 2 [Knufia fluminis]